MSHLPNMTNALEYQQSRPLTVILKRRTEQHVHAT